MVDSGLSPTAALQTATINPAQMLGSESEHGTIEAGKYADIVLLQANPLEKIGNTSRIELVVCNGELLNRKSLDTMLGEMNRENVADDE